MLLMEKGEFCWVLLAGGSKEAYRLKYFKVVFLPFKKNILIPVHDEIIEKHLKQNQTTVFKNFLWLLLQVFIEAIKVKES